MENTLLLNASYEPINVISWKKALTLLFQGKVEVIAEYEKELHSITFSIKLPSVLRLLKYIKLKSNFTRIKFSRYNIYLRDDFSCQYCGKRFRSEELTFDHVVPVARGGGKSWENIVTCCVKCNHTKGGRTPEQANMKLIRPPRAPEWLPTTLKLTIGVRSAPESWRDYLYWNAELDG